MRIRKCPEDCSYRSREVNFCGFCMMDVLERKGVKSVENDRQQEACGAEDGDSAGSGHGEEDRCDEH